MNVDPTSERLPSGTPPQNLCMDFEVYANEPVMRFLVHHCRSSPTTLILGFYGLVTVPLFVMSAFSQASCPVGRECLSFRESISWSYSVIFLFPFVVGLTLVYYRKIPELYKFLIKELLEEGNQSDIRNFLEVQRKRFTEHWSPVVLIVLTLTLNGVYFRQVLNDEQFDWMNSGSLFKDLLNTAHGLTWQGLYAAFVQIVLIYWVLNLIWKGFVLAFGLREFFNEAHLGIKLDPLHPDGVCGLRPIGRVASTLNFILFLIGIYLSLKVIDKTVVQGSSLFEDIGNPVMLGGYAILAPLLFFLPLAAAHDRMLNAKDRFLRPISARCHVLVQQIGAMKPDGHGVEHAISLSLLEKLRDDLNKTIPVWPFDFKSLQVFFGAVVVPLLPIIFPVLAKLLLQK
jgi:hypothetical protein